VDIYRPRRPGRVLTGVVVKAMRQLRLALAVCASVMIVAGCTGTDTVMGGPGIWPGGVWVYDCAVNTWTHLRPEGNPPVSSDVLVVYDSKADSVLAVAEDFKILSQYHPETNEWVSTEVGGELPSPRLGGSVFYDEDLGAVLLFGGNQIASSQGVSLGGPRLQEVWSYDAAANQWSERRVTGDLPGSGAAMTAMVYDSTRHEYLLFSGWWGADSVPADTWVYDADGGRWKTIGHLDGPANRSFDYSVVYVPTIDRVLLFGGTSLGDPADGPTSDVWSYDPGTHTWARLNPSGESPVGRQSAVMAYDPVGDRILVCGGVHVNDGTTSLLTDIWSYDVNLNVWTDLQPENALKHPASSGRAVFDQARRSLLVIGQ
jgi:hypothetical protein